MFLLDIPISNQKYHPKKVKKKRERYVNVSNNNLDTSLVCSILHNVETNNRWNEKTCSIHNFSELTSTLNLLGKFGSKLFRTRAEVIEVFNFSIAFLTGIFAN